MITGRSGKGRLIGTGAMIGDPIDHGEDRRIAKKAAKASDALLTALMRHHG